MKPGRRSPSLSLFNCALGQMMELSGFYLPQLITHERHSLLNLLHQSVLMYVLSLFDHLIGFQSLHSQPSFTSCYFCCVLSLVRHGDWEWVCTHSGNLECRKHSLLSLLRHKLHSIFMPLNALYSKTNLPDRFFSASFSTRASFTNPYWLRPS